jgi:superfamily II DNA helicase RecQ
MDNMEDWFISCVSKGQIMLNINRKLKDKQLECWNAIVVKKCDVISVLPTGYGKTYIYSLLPYVLDLYNNCKNGSHLVLVVSPLIALMHEQVTKLTANGLSCIQISDELADKG